jgi:hypothetical protein
LTQNFETLLSQRKGGRGVIGRIGRVASFIPISNGLKFKPTLKLDSLVNEFMPFQLDSLLEAQK